MPDQFPALAKELTGLQPNLLLSDSTPALKQETHMFNFCPENCLQSELVAYTRADDALVELYRDIGDQRRSIWIGDCAGGRAGSVGKVDKKVFRLGAPIAAERFFASAIESLEGNQVNRCAEKTNVLWVDVEAIGDPRIYRSGGPSERSVQMYTAGEVNLEPTPRRGIRRYRPRCRRPAPDERPHGLSHST